MADPQQIDEFALQRKRAQDDSATRLQTRKDALTRRYAQLGNFNSGSRVKQEQIATQDEAQNLQKTDESIDAAQRAEAKRLKEVQEGRQFASSEREASQGFAAGQAALGRQFSTGERLGSQEYGTQQADLQRKFATGERLSGQDFGALQAQLGRDFTSQEREAIQKYQSGERQAGQQFSTGERLGGQEFTSAQTDLARQFATGERKDSQAFAAYEAEKGRNFSTKERMQGQNFASKEAQKQRTAAETLADKQMAQQDKQFQTTYGLSMDQFTEAKRQFDQTFAQDVYVTEENLKLAKKMANEQGLLEGLGSAVANPLKDLGGITSGGFKKALGYG